MPLSARDLPRDLKQQLLERAEEQIGWAEYQRLLAQLGEDGLLDLILQSAAAAGADAPLAPKRRVDWGAVLHRIVWSLLFPAFWVSWSSWFDGLLGFALSAASLCSWVVIISASNNGVDLGAGIAVYLGVAFVFYIVLTIASSGRPQ